MQQNNQLLKLLGVGFGIAATVGGTIGSGILRRPGPIAESIGDPTLIMFLWLAVGIYAFFGVLCVIELALSMPQAGAWYVYARRALGSYFGFLTGTTSWFGTVSALGFGAYTFAEYVSLLTGWSDYNQLMAIGLLVFFTILHYLGTRIGDKTQQILAATVALALILFVIVCFTMGGNITTPAFEQTMSNTAKPAMIFGIIAALQSIFYAYDGWHTATYFTEENTDPIKTMPKAMITGVLVVIGVYLLVNAAILYVIPMEYLKGKELAAADAMGLIFGENAKRYVTLFLLLSVIGITNSQVMFAPRVLYSMGRDKLFGKFATVINKEGTPYMALFCTSILSIILILIGKKTCGMLSDIASFFFVLSYTFGFISLIKLRYSEPEMPRPFKAPLFPVLPIVLTVLSFLFLIGAISEDLKSSEMSFLSQLASIFKLQFDNLGLSVYAFLFLILSYPIYLLVRKWNAR